MPGLPAILETVGRRCVVVGGGAVALRRTRGLLVTGAKVLVVAPRMDPAFETLPVERQVRAYVPGDLDNAMLVIIATDDSKVNQRIADDARAAGVLVNRTDQPEAGDFCVPAHAHHGPVTIAVHTQGISAQAAATIRRSLSEALDPAWPTMLDTIAPYRERIQQAVPDTQQRLELLRELTGEGAITCFRAGGIEALRQFCENLLHARQPDAAPTPTRTASEP